MYIELHRDHDVLVLDAASTIGGVWATDRLYPGLKTNNMLGTFEYPDFPMGEATYDVKPGQHIPAATVHQYLLDYATKFGVLERVRFNTKVEIVEPAEGGTWRLTTFSSVQHAPKPISVLTKRLIVATGLTSEPSMPEILGMQDFIPPLFHSKDFRQNAETLKTAERVVVLGGAKSAWDVAYEYASAGVSVEMVIRESGHGPVWMSPPYVTPLKKWLEKLVHTRFLTFLSPCIWGDEDGYEATRNFLHGTTIGRKLVDIFWTVLTEDVVSLNRYDSHPETKKLKPWAGAFWVGTGLSILNYPTDFFDYVRSGKIHVHIADIDRLLPHSLRFKSSVHNSGLVL